MKLCKSLYTTDTQTIGQMIKIDFTNQETYQLIKLYDLLRDTDMLDDLPVEIETAFDKIQDEQVNQQHRIEKAQAKQPNMEW